MPRTQRTREQVFAQSQAIDAAFALFLGEYAPMLLKPRFGGRSISPAGK
jgi:uncharacterized protein involved in response to NO